jgi:hypothetical protein
MGAQPYEIPDDAELPAALLSHPLGARRLWAMVRQLERSRGWCYAGQKYLADHLGCTDRSVRRYIARLIADGLLSIRWRKGAPALMRVRIVSRADNRGSPGADRSVRGVGHICPTRVGHKCPTNNKNTSKHSTPLFEPVAWNPWSAMSMGGDPIEIFLAAFRDRCVSQIKDGESWRVILEARRRDATAVHASPALQLKLAVDSAGRDGKAFVWLTIYANRIPTYLWRA